MQNKKEKIICFEGVDGSGKTTLSKYLTKICKGKYLKSPPDSIAATRHLIKDCDDSITFHHYIFGNAAAGFSAQKESSKKLVFLDRYHYSTRAYHYQIIKNGAQVPDMPKEDLIVFLHADWDTIEKRLSNRKDRKPHEQIENLKKIHDKYENILSKKDNILKIDTGKYSLKEAAQMILKKIKHEIR